MHERGDWGEGQSAKYCHLSWSWYRLGKGEVEEKGRRGYPKHTILAHPIISLPLGFIYPVTSFCKVLLLGCRSRRCRAQFRFPSGSSWLFLGSFAPKTSNIPTVFSLPNKSDGLSLPTVTTRQNYHVTMRLLCANVEKSNPSGHSPLAPRLATTAWQDLGSPHLGVTRHYCYF